MSTGSAWPWVGDSPMVIVRRVAGAYRARLAEVDEASCALLDEQMVKWGQGWVVVRLFTFDLDDWLSARDAAELACVQVRQIARLRRLGRLHGRRVGKRWQYQAREVLAVSTHARSRRRRQGHEQSPEGIK